MSYKKLGLKCGIEIHQQLDGKKLFCNCPTLIRDDKPDFSIKRKLRAVAGEHGKIDVAAMQEQLRNKNFVYQGYEDTICLVETDSEPPFISNFFLIGLVNILLIGLTTVLILLTCSFEDGK